MFTQKNYFLPSFFLNFVAILLLLINFFSFGNTFTPGIATWYGNPGGAGSDGGACGYQYEVENPPYYALIVAGNNNIYNSGKGCGACYQVKCSQNSQCSGQPITVTVTDQCPGCAYNQLDLSGKAFGSLAKPGQDNALRSAGKINIEYQRVSCYYGTSILFRIDKGSNPYYLSFVSEYVNGDGELGLVEVLPSSSKGWIPMQQLWGATWKVDLPGGTRGPFSVRLTSAESRRSIVAYDVIPANWTPGGYYKSNVNF